jgi:hypothetical protein
MTVLASRREASRHAQAQESAFFSRPHREPQGGAHCLRVALAIAVLTHDVRLVHASAGSGENQSGM